ncbi:MAG: helix-turn-helix transcriptional regulator [Clostridia bacterium]|nr:helix-turn-helix transcriptional regulator [Clostridia bacterium]
MYYMPTNIKNSITIDSIYTIHYFEYHKNYYFTGEKHDFWELLYVDKGEIIVTINEKEILLKQNQLILYSPNQFHSVRANGSVAPNTVIVSFGCRDKILNKISNRIYFINSYEHSFLSGIIREAKFAYKNNLSDPTYRKLKKQNIKDIPASQYGAEQMIKCFLEILLIEFLRSKKYAKKNSISIEQSQTHLQTRFEFISTWINEHIDTNFTVSDLCTKAMLGKSALESLFKENTGMSVIAYCRKMKTEAAKKMLREDIYNVSQISELLGFSSVHYFSRTFKKLENISPSEYAKSVKAVIDHATLIKSR